MEELLRKANAGDVNAMWKLASYYQQKSKEEDWYQNKVKSLTWTEKVAEAGVWEGVYSCANGFSCLAYVNEDINVACYDEAFDQWATSEYWAKVALTQYELDDEEIKLFTEIKDESAYGMASDLYFLDEPINCMEAIQNQIGEKYNILRGCCAFKTKDYSKAYQELKVIENSPQYIGVINQKMSNEKRVFVRGFRLLAKLYTVGLQGVINKNLDNAVKILNNALNAIDDERLKEQLQKDLRGYKKTIFGSYKWQG